MRVCETVECTKKALIQCPLCGRWVCMRHVAMVGCVIRLCLTCYEAEIEALDSTGTLY